MLSFPVAAVGQPGRSSCPQHHRDRAFGVLRQVQVHGPDIAGKLRVGQGCHRGVPGRLLGAPMSSMRRLPLGVGPRPGPHSGPQPRGDLPLSAQKGCEAGLPCQASFVVVRSLNAEGPLFPHWCGAMRQPVRWLSRSDRGSDALAKGVRPGEPLSGEPGDAHCYRCGNLGVVTERGPRTMVCITSGHHGRLPPIHTTRVANRRSFWSALSIDEN